MESGGGLQTKQKKKKQAGNTELTVEALLRGDAGEDQQTGTK